MAGLLLITVTFTPVLHYWTAALSTPWRTDGRGVLIVLGGDIVGPDMIGSSSYWRSCYAVLEWRTGRYSRMIVTGKNIAPLMKDFIAGQGVPWQAITVENAAISTRENALNTSRLLSSEPGPKVLLTSDFHMGRALQVFRKAGIVAQPLPVPDAGKRLLDRTQRWGIFCALLEESAKVGWYRLHGWE